MSNRKYESDYEKLKKKWKVEKLIESQCGAFDKFVIIHKNDAEASSIGENVINHSQLMQRKRIQKAHNY